MSLTDPKSVITRHSELHIGAVRRGQRGAMTSHQCVPGILDDQAKSQEASPLMWPGSSADPPLTLREERHHDPLGTSMGARVKARSRSISLWRVANLAKRSQYKDPFQEGNSASRAPSLFPMMFTVLSLSLIAASFTATLVSGSPVELDVHARQLPPADRYYQITNSCPTAINLYSAGLLQRSLAAGETTTQFATGFTPGPFYTDANGGSAGGERSTKAAFWDRRFYYLVKDPNHLNVAMSVAPDRFGRQGLCVPIACRSSVCDQGFPIPGPATLPGPETGTPSPPMYACGTEEGVSLQWNITFCPDGTFPTQTQGGPLKAGADPNKCLDVQGGVFANGTPVQIYDCNGTAAQRWVFVRGSTKVRLAGTNFCLDAGSNPANGIGMKIWQCYDNLRAQQWNYEQWTDRIRLDAQVNGRDYCVDLDSGILTNGNKVQTWECQYQNTNMIWSNPS